MNQCADLVYHRLKQNNSALDHTTMKHNKNYIQERKIKETIHYHSHSTFQE